ncbi:MAG: hypothetical protein EPO55_07420 [Reyranella sp.]|uniref:hypothetical protein n=1 Tax=Reyranella sp. TaxID=1929291 RepID=UPI0012135C14|nr:hypothetical protein [Reyranella sp.]TAJ40920.1 MAG: hypothetical protein EPO55_07420 [Reyranella sp.]
MKAPSELVLFGVLVAVAGWLAAKGEFAGAVVAALLSAAFLADFLRDYCKEMKIAQKWRLDRWNALQELERKYRAEVYGRVPPKLDQLNDRIRDAEKRAAAEIQERFGPLP